MLRVAGLIQRVIPSNPRVIPISSGNLFPKPDGSVLMILIIPESGIAGWIIGMPVWILAAWDGVHI